MQISSHPSKVSSIAVILINLFFFMFVHTSIRSGRELISERWRCPTQVSSCPWNKQGLHKSNIPPSRRCVPHPGRGSGSLQERERESAAGSTRSFFWSFVWYLGPGSLLTYFHLRDSAWAAAALSDILKQNEKLAAAAAAWFSLLLNHFPPSRCSALFFPSLPWFVLPCSTAIYLMEPWMQPASCCRCRYIMWMSFRSGSFKFHDHWFDVLYQIRLSETLSIKAARPHLGGNVQVFYGCTKGRKRP